MDDEAKHGCAVAATFLLAVILAFMFGWGYGSDRKEQDCRQEAIAAGHARWAADQKTGEVKFEWLPVGAEKGK